jgi:hypothetical protein
MILHHTGDQEMDESCKSSKIREVLGRGDLTMCCTEMAVTTISEVLLWVQGDGKAHQDGVHEAL